MSYNISVAIKKLIWDEWNRNHIKKHKITKKEIEYVYKTSNIKLQSYFKRTLLLGKTKSGRLITVVLSYDKQKDPYVVSARDMSRKERRYYDLQTKTN